MIYQAQTIARGIVGAPQISGDGRTVVWNQKVDGNVDIYRYHDGQVDRVSSDPRQDIHPTVNHDGSVITWSRFSTLDPNDKEGNFDIVAWRNGQETVVAEGRADQTDPVVSPDGSRLAWTSDLDGKQQNYVIELHENGQTQTLTSPKEANLYPVFAGDSGRMIWRSYREDGSDLVLRDEQGTVKPITFDSADEVRPCITDDGKTVFYHVESPEGDDDLYRLSLEPNGFSELSAEKQVDESWPVCSGDGKSVAWTNFDRRGDKTRTHVYLNEDGVSQQISWGSGMHTNVSIAGTSDRLAYLWMNPDDMDNRRIVLLERKL